MKESLNIHQQQQTTQRLSPRQVQFARLLEMTAPEVEEEVRRQLDDNPALEAADSLDGDYEDEAEEGAGENGLEGMDSDYGQADAGYEGDKDDDPADYYRPSGAASYDWGSVSETADLYTYLSSQLGQIELDEDIRKIALYIIGNIDENGYMTRGLQSMADDLAISGEIDATKEQMREAFDAVRGLDPAGVGAVDLRDCLLLQLRRRQPSDLTLRIAKEVVGDYFDMLSKKHYDRMQAQLGLDDREELRKALALIRSLNPKPGSAIAVSPTAMRTSHITPDVIVDDLGEGRMSVSLAGRIPKLQLERTFALDGEGDKPRTKGEREAQAFIKLKHDDAQAFIEAIKQRGETLLNVAQAIVKRQTPFFQSGDMAQLRPMILKDIAADTGYDISVVSRSTAGKYLATAMGVYPMKMFFGEAPTEDADASAHELMDAISQIVGAEDKQRPLSDQAILEELEKRGYKMARRTITKYREKLGLPVARLRKED
ncbi:MAG: RNA polymerase factor sigma-54 [Clostridium sp.]|nr:RNA polymerase factor sigma-54 [Clostridium sp.]